MEKYTDSLRGYAFAVHKRDQFKCRYCGVDGTRLFDTWLSLSWDHLLPIGHPNRDNPEFIVTACNFCNVADNQYFVHAEQRGLKFDGLSRDELVAQRKPYVMRTRQSYREFWELKVAITRPQPNVTELRKITDRLFYEWRMLTNPLPELRALADKLPKTSADELLESAFVESCAVHARALVDFFYAYDGNRRLRDDDAIANDFFPNLGIWKNACPTRSKELTRKAFKDFANRQIVHIVYDKRDKHEWYFEAIADALQPVIEKFISMVQAEQLGKRWRKELESRSGPRWDGLKSLVAAKNNTPSA
jgi:hypothetical protein